MDDVVSGELLGLAAGVVGDDAGFCPDDVEDEPPPPPGATVGESVGSPCAADRVRA